MLEKLCTNNCIFSPNLKKIANTPYNGAGFEGKQLKSCIQTFFKDHDYHEILTVGQFGLYFLIYGYNLPNPKYAHHKWIFFHFNSAFYNYTARHID